MTEEEKYLNYLIQELENLEINVSPMSLSEKHPLCSWDIGKDDIRKIEYKYRTALNIHSEKDVKVLDLKTKNSQVQKLDQILMSKIMGLLSNNVKYYLAKDFMGCLESNETQDIILLPKKDPLIREWSLKFEVDNEKDGNLVTLTYGDREVKTFPLYWTKKSREYIIYKLNKPYKLNINKKPPHMPFLDKSEIDKEGGLLRYSDNKHIREYCKDGWIATYTPLPHKIQIYKHSGNIRALLLKEIRKRYNKVYPREVSGNKEPSQE